MSTYVEDNTTDTVSVATVASAFARARQRHGEGRSNAFCVRLSPTVKGLLDAAKPERQSMPEFLRECALTVALQRLEASQN